MPDINKTVGVGKDYATLTLWNAGEGGVDPGDGFTSIALCTGYCGAGANINGTFVRGATIKGDTTFDGTNDSLISSAERLTISSDSGISVQDLRIFTNNQFVAAMNYSADFILMDRIVFDNTTSGQNALDINGAFTNGHIRNFVARGGSDSVMSGFNQGTNLTNGLIYGAVDKGIEGGGSAPMVLTNIFAFNNGGEDIDSGGGFTINDCATEDNTGTYTGYTSSELVDFANGNLRTKATSPLATLGAPFVGLFLEPGGVSGVSGDISFDISPVEFSVAGSVTLPAPSGDIYFDIGSVDFSASASATLPKPSGDISFDIPSVIFSGEASATLSYLSGDISFSIEPIEFSIEASATLPNPECDIDFTVPAVEFSCAGAASLPQPQCAISFSVDSVEFSATGSATIPSPSGDIEFTVEPIEFTIHGSTTITISDVALPVGSLITPKATSNIITLPKTSNLIKL